MPLKAQLIQLVEYMQEQMVSFPDLLTPEQVEASGKVDDWSAKDNLFHCLFWAGNQLEILETLEKGADWDDSGDNDFEAINREKFVEFENRSWGDGRSLAKEKYQGMLAYLHRIEDDVLQQIRKDRENPVWREILSLYITHPMIHLWEQLTAAGKVETVAEIFGDEYHNMLLALDDGESYQGGVFYNQACLLALTGELEEAVKVLEKALKMTPALIEWSQEDSDLEALRELPKYLALYT